MNRLKNLSISYKLSLGFGMLVFLTLLVVSIGYFNSARATEKINTTKNLHEPTALTSIQAQTLLLEMQSNVHGYLVLGSPEFQEGYELSRSEFETILQEMNTLSENWDDLASKQYLTKLQTLYAEWKPLPAQLFELHSDDLANQPAQRILAEEGQPHISLIETNIDSIIDAQNRRDISADSMALLNDQAEFNSSFIGMVSAIRGYLVTTNPSFKFEYQVALSQNQSAWERIQNNFDLLTAEQQTLFTQIAEARDEFLPLPPKMFEALEGEHAYEDLYLFRTEALPLATDMLNTLDTLAVAQREQLQADLSLSSSYLTTFQKQTFLWGLLTLLLGTVLAFITTRNIATPITALTSAAEQIKAGKLDTHVSIESTDEIGTLAKTFNDMTTQLRQTLEYLNEAKNEAERANQVKSSFLAAMSHELRTPLNGIINFTGFIMDGMLGPVNEKQIEVLQDTMANGEHLLALINDVLDISKIESGSLKLFIEENIDLPEIINSIVSTGKSMLKDKPVELYIDMQQDIPKITADKRRIKQIVLNIVSNACKFTDAGAVSINLYQQNNEIVIAVTDTGPGIAIDDQQAVFEAFRQTDAGLRQGEGTGLGMPISKRLAEAHNGRLWLESELGKGTTFYVSLPTALKSKLNFAVV
jgi:signal transduction histidine kinase